MINMQFLVSKLAQILQSHSLQPKEKSSQKRLDSHPQKRNQINLPKSSSSPGEHLQIH